MPSAVYFRQKAEQCRRLAEGILSRMDPLPACQFAHHALKHRLRSRIFASFSNHPIECSLVSNVRFGVLRG